MDNIYDFFISHSSNDNDKALELYHVLKEINSEWKIWLDCGPENPLDSEIEWNPAMLTHAQNSRYLIFLATAPDYLKEGYGHLYEEVASFHGKCVTRFRNGHPDRTMAYFGILFGSIDFEMDLYSDKVRGSEYFSMYNSRQHIILGENETVRDGFERIRQKVLNMTGKVDDNSAEILDRVNAYTRRRQQQDDAFSMNAIDGNLLPEMYTESGAAINFNAFCKKLKKTHAAVLGEQGGCGKTTFMTRLFFHYLERAKVDDPNAMIPLFVDARALIGKDHLILRFLTDRLFQEYTARTAAETSSNTGLLSYAFSQQNENPRYLLLIDGCNEIPAASLTAFNREMMEFGEYGRYRNVRIVLTGRNMKQFSLAEETFFRVSIGHLNYQQVYAYLDQFRHTSEPVKDFLRRIQSNELRGSREQSKTKDLIEILKTPIFSWIFAQSRDAEQIRTRGELIRQFIRRQEKNVLDSEADDQLCAFHFLCLYHILPSISFQMTTGAAASGYAFTEDEMYPMIRETLEQMHSTAYRIHYGTEYRRCLKEAIPSIDELDVGDQFVFHMTNNGKLLRRTAEGTFEFVHQIYRDYFAAYYITEDILRTFKDGSLCGSLHSASISRDTFQFVSELLGEYHHPFDWDTKESAYNESRLPVLLDIARKHETDTAQYTANVVELLRRVRSDDLSGLDLTKSNLRTCMLARKSDSETWAANFHGAVINPDNLLDMTHGSNITTACVNSQFFITCDETGTVMFWNRNGTARFPAKILKLDVSGLKKILVAPNGQSLYAITDTQLLQIPIPDVFQSKVKAIVLLQTNKTFWDIRLDDRGEPEFTTAMNPFNFKPVSNPDQKDHLKFRRVNSCAAVNDAGNYLACGFLPYQNGLKLWKMDRETNQWAEQRFGYSAILDTYIRRLEELFREFGVYAYFAGKRERRKLISGARLQCFDALQKNGEFENRCRKYSLASMQEYLLRKLSARGILLTLEQISRLDQLRQDIAQQVSQGLRKDAALMALSRRDIRSVAWKKDTNILLIAYSHPCYDAEGPERKGLSAWKNIVAELDVDSMTVRLIAQYSSNRSVTFCASYSDDRIVILHRGHAYLYNDSGEQERWVGHRNSRISSFVAVGEEEICVVSKESIYRLDGSHCCSAAWYNDLKETNLVFCIGPDGRKCLVKRSSFVLAERGTLSAKTPILNLHNGLIEKINRDAFMQLVPVDYADRAAMIPSHAVCVGSRAYHYNAGTILCYDGDIKNKEFDVYHKLLVCGCDFREIRGGMAVPEYLQILKQYGAQTDNLFEETVSTVTDEPDAAQWIPSREAFHPRPSGDIVLPECGKPDDVTEFYWGTIQEKLKDCSYSVMKWINALGVATPEMLSQLISAKIICEACDEKLEDILTFMRKHGLIYQPIRADQNHPVYSLTNRGGKALIWPAFLPYQNIDQSKGTWEKTRGDLCKKLRNNLWFCTMAQKYAKQLCDYGVYTVFDSTVRISARGRIKGYLKLAEQAFFAEPVLILDSEEAIRELRKKTQRMCSIAGGYGHLQCLDRSYSCRVELSRAPILIFIGRDYDHCVRIDANIRDIQPGIRKLYTYDALLDDCNREDMYFEFVEDMPWTVKLDDLIREFPAGQDNEP